ncbi:MAG: ATP-binding protein [Gemmataceae bacterium]
MSRLVVIKGIDEGRQFELRDAVISIGRDSSSRIRLNDTEVSRRHAEFRREGDGVRVIDVGSANGTFVNQKRVQEALLQPGDRIAIGQSVLVFAPSSQVSVESPGLAQQISMIAKSGEGDFPSAIVGRVSEVEGSRIFSRPDRSILSQGNAAANLSILYEATQAISHILDLDELLEQMMELVFRAVPADRGCILLRDEEGSDPMPQAIHWRRPEDRRDKFTMSRTIVDHVLQQREGVLLADASSDVRFRDGESIMQQGIREVICVPMRGRHETLGVLYLDTRFTSKELLAQPTITTKFHAEHLNLAIALAHQAALAVEETRYYQAMVQAERLAAIGQTIAALSHHIKNILQGLRSGGEILKMGLDEKNDKLVQQGWRVAEKNQAKIYDLVLDMLSYSKEREPALEMTDVTRLVRDICELLEPRAKETGSELVVNVPDSPLRVSLDPEGIHRALLNLVGNAIDAVEGRPEARVVVSARIGDDGYCTITVEDNGVGIRPERIKEIFKPFVSTKGSRGTGLGLPVSQKILREHGGDLLVQSQLDIGSRFTLLIPLKSPISPESGITSEMPLLPPDE